jgi:hypothetical protein
LRRLSGVVVVVVVDVVVRIGGNVSATPLAVGPHAGASSISSAMTTVGSNTARCMARQSYVPHCSALLSIAAVDRGRHQRTIDVSRAYSSTRCAARRPEISTSGTLEPGTVEAPTKTRPGTRRSTLFGRNGPDWSTV